MRRRRFRLIWDVYSVQRVLLAAGAICCLLLLKNSLDNHPLARHRADTLQPNANGYERPTTDRVSTSDDYDDSTGCEHLHGLDRIVIILKTGSTEIYEKLPIHFTTTFACNVDRLIYSDAEQEFSNHPVRDALALVSPDLRLHAKDFEQYRILRDYTSHGGGAAHLKGDKSWELDKWKFLPMVSDAYDVFGDDKEWYVFIEADTYLSLHNLLLWLATLDATEPIYAGAPVMIGTSEFAHGGSGFMLSASAVKALTDTYREEEGYWEDYLLEECCGDKVIADVLLDATPPVPLLRSFPLIQGEILSSLDWSSVHWCRPAITWHHVDASGIDRLWKFDRDWADGPNEHEPILFRDYYGAFIHPRLAAADWYMENWDNLSGDFTVDAKDNGNKLEAHRNETACEAFCWDIKNCVQWSWTQGLCRGSPWVRLGWAANNRPSLGSDERIEDVDGQEELVSGWLPERIEAFMDRMEPCEEDGFWVVDD